MSRSVSRPATPVQEYFTPEPIHNTPFRNKTPDAGVVLQTDIRQDLGPYNNPDMFVCQLQHFLASYGPCLNVTEDDDVDPLIPELVKAGNLVQRADGTYRWFEYCRSNPSNFGVREAKTFEHLVPIVNNVLKNVKEKGKIKTDIQFISVPYSKLSSDIPGSDHKIDACFIAEPLTPKYKPTKVPNRKINVPLEYKKKRNANDRSIVHLQILGACQHIMNEDIRRMWIYGLTFEDHLCSVWYFSRSHSVKTLVFDWIKDPKVFIQVLQAFAKATPRELGIDPTVHLGPKNTDGTTSFVYEVPNSGGAEPRFYKTVQAVYNPRPEAIAGRTTRVWKVVEVASATGEQVIDEKEVILKDVWLNEGSKTEAENMDAIFAAVDEFVDNGITAILANNPTATRESLLSPDVVKETMGQIIEADIRFRSFDNISKARLSSNLANKAYRSLFLVKLHAWQGEVCKPIGNKVSRCPSLFSSLSIEALEKKGAQSTSVNTRQQTAENSTQPKLGEKQRKEQDKENAVQRSRRFAPKRQSRCIYQEVCTTLQNLDTVGDVVDVLCQTMEAMHILFLAGWVHRDLSSNNIMAYRSSSNERWAVKLADLEFSRLMVDPTRAVSADPRTGTPFFMPVEILSRQYLLYQHKKGPEDEESNDQDEDEDEDESGDEDEDPQKSTEALDGLEEEHEFMTLADQLKISIGGEGSVDDYLHQFKAFQFRVVVPPDPHWDKIPRPSAAMNHNYQHDLESIWWILLWIILCRIKPNEADDSLKLPYEVTQYFDHDIWNFHPRLLLFITTLDKIKIYLDKRILKHFLNPMEKLRHSMYARYLTREVFGQLEVSESYTSIQVQFAQVLRALRDGPGAGRCRDVGLKKRKTPSEDLQNKSAPNPHATAGSSRKRERERDSAEYQDKKDGGKERNKDKAKSTSARKTPKKAAKRRRT